MANQSCDIILKWTQRRGIAALIVVATITTCLAGPIGTVSAHAGERSDAAAILDKYVEVTGGAAAYLAIYNRVSKGRVVHVGMGFEDSITTFEAAPNKFSALTESEALGSINRGTNGDVVWYLSSQAGPMIELEEPRKAELLNRSFDRVTNWRKYYRKVERVGEETIGGKACHKVVMTPNSGETETRYYDMKSNLPVAYQKTRISSNMPTVVIDVAVGDYKRVDDLLIPHEVRSSYERCGSKREKVFIVDAIEHNVELPANRFDPPAEVLALTRSAGDRHQRVKSSPCCEDKQARSGCCGKRKDSKRGCN